MTLGIFGAMNKHCSAIYLAYKSTAIYLTSSVPVLIPILIYPHAVRNMGYNVCSDAVIYLLHV